MSYDIIPVGDMSNVPDYVRADGPSELTRSLMSGGGSQLKRISIRGRVFRCIVNGEEVAKNKNGYMDVIILNVAKDYNRTYYEGSYDPKAEAKPPRCWSADSKTPAKNVPEPMAASCDACPMNIKGSGQGDSRACRMKRRMAVALASDLNSGVYQIELPGASVFGKGDGENMPANVYFRYVGSQNYSIERVVTRMYFDDDADNPKLFFTVVGFPSPAMLPKLNELLDSEEAKEAVGIQVFETDKVNTPKQLQLPIESASEEEEEEEEEVVVVKKKKRVAKPPVVEVEEEDEDDDEESFGAPTVIKKKAKAKPTKIDGDDDDELNSILNRFASKNNDVDDDEDEDED